MKKERLDCSTISKVLYSLQVFERKKVASITITCGLPTAHTSCVVQIEPMPIPSTYIKQCWSVCFANYISKHHATELITDTKAVRASRNQIQSLLG